MAISRRLFVGSGLAAAASYLVGADRVAAARKPPKGRHTFAPAGLARGVGAVGIAVARTRILDPPSDWPDATNTGVPAGTSLTTFSSGDFETTSNGQIVQDLDVTNGAVVVNHANVTVRRCRISSPSFAGVYLAGSGTHLIEDCEIDCKNTAGSSGLFWSTTPAVTARRLNIHSVENGAGPLGNFDMQDCWIHDMDPGGGDPHTDGLQISDGDNIVIHHNLIDAHFPVDGTSAIITPQSVGSLNNVQITNNKLWGGAYTFYVPVNPCTDFYFDNNRMISGAFGYFSSADWGNITSHVGNVDDLTEAPL